MQNYKDLHKEVGLNALISGGVYGVYFYQICKVVIGTIRFLVKIFIKILIVGAKLFSGRIC